MARGRRRSEGGDPKDRGEPGGRLKVPLSFRQTRCLKCGATRVVTQPCPDCEAAPRAGEADPSLQRRQRVAWRVLGEVDRPHEVDDDAATSRPLELDEIAGRLAGWPTRFLEALSLVGVPGGAEDELLALIAELRGVRSLVDRPIFRPWRSVCAAATATISQLEDVARAYLHAIAAPTPLDAQRFASEAQVLLDGAADPISELRAKQRRVSTIESAPPSEMPVALVEAVSAEAGGASGLHGLQVVEAAGADLSCRVTGAAAAPTGAGTAMYLAALVAEVSLDYPRFLRVSRRSWELFTTGSDSLRRLTSDPTWLAGHRESLVELLELSITGAAMGAAAVTDRMRVDSLLQAVHRLIEGPVQHGLATLLTSTKGRPYSKLSAGDAAALLRQAEQHGLGELLEGLGA